MPRVISDELFDQLIQEIKDGKKLGGEGRWKKLEKDSPRVEEIGYSAVLDAAGVARIYEEKIDA